MLIACLGLGSECGMRDKKESNDRLNARGKLWPRKISAKFDSKTFDDFINSMGKK